MARAIIMAAGVGRRLEGAIGDIPKSLINLDGESLIERQIKILKNCNIKKIAVVVGYRKEKIKEKLGDKVSYFFNPFFETTNSITSLWFAKDFLHDEDVLVINGDTLTEPSVIEDLLKNKSQICVAVEIGRYNPLGYKVSIKDNFVKFMSMNIDKSEVSGEYAGMSKISKNTLSLLIENLDHFMEKKEFSIWYENAYVDMIQHGVKVSYIDINDRFWLEIDTLEDIEKASQYFDFKLQAE